MTHTVLIAAVKNVIDLLTFNSKFARNATFSRKTHQHVQTVQRLANEWCRLWWQRTTSQVNTDVIARYDDTKEMGKLECLQESYIICHNFLHRKTVEVHEKTAKQGKQHGQVCIT